MPPSQFNVFQLHAVFGENRQNNRLAFPPLGLENPGSLTGIVTNKLKSSKIRLDVHTISFTGKRDLTVVDVDYIQALRFSI